MISSCRTELGPPCHRRCRWRCHADIVLGSMVVSMAMPDVRPITDGRGIEFNPSAPDPGEEVTVTVYIENAGTADTEEVVDVAIFANGEKIGGRALKF